MIGKPEWFARRKYGGWGLFPKTWQGWAYALIMAAPLLLVQYAPFLAEDIKVIFMLAWAVLFAADVVHIMIKLKLDEREKIHEAIAERNALWAIITVIVVGVAYQAASSAVKGIVSVDPFLIAAVVVGLIVKAVSNLYLDKKD
jgi:hypothetical protein